MQNKKTISCFLRLCNSYYIEILNTFNPELQRKDTEFAVRNKLTYLFSELESLEFMATLALELKKIKSDDKAKYDIFYLDSKAETIVNESYIYNVFESIYTSII